MSIVTEISRIQASKNTIKAKLVELGLATGTDKLDRLASAIETIVKHGAVDINVKEGESYTIPAGYHDGSGTVKGVAGGGNYNLQTGRTVTPAKKVITVTSDEGYYGLDSVTVNPIPDNYQDVTGVTAGAGDVLVGKMIVGPDGTPITGTMTNQGAVDRTLDVTVITYTIPAGYHNGNGVVKISLEEKSVTPSEAEQVITPATGKVISKVTVAPIPSQYKNTSDATITADHVLAGEIAYGTDGAVEGTMPNNGAQKVVLDVAKPSANIALGYHNGDGVISIAPEAKSVTPTKSTQNVTPTTGKVLSKVTIDPIPAAYQDVTPVTTVAANVLDGDKFVDKDGSVVVGSMPNNGDVSSNLDGMTTTNVVIPAGYTAGGTISLTNDIEAALAEI